MLKKEIFDTLKSRKSRVACVIFILLVLYDFADKIYFPYSDYLLHPEAYPDGLPQLMHPALAGFLNGGLSSDNMRYLMHWLLPIWCLLFCGDSFIREKKNGYVPLMNTRISRKKYFWGKNGGAFVCGFFLMFFCLLVNFLLCIIGFFNGKDFLGLDEFVRTTSWFDFSLAHPIPVYFLYIFINAVVMGLLCCMCTSLCMALPYYPLVYAIAFMVWYPQVSNDYSILLAMQPFLNYPAKTFLIAYLIFLIPVALCMIAGYIRRVKCDVL